MYAAMRIVEDGAFLPAGMYKVKAAGKVVTKNAAGAVLRRRGDHGGRQPDRAGARRDAVRRDDHGSPATGGVVAGMRLEEADFGKVFAAVVEEASWVKVEE